MRTSVLAAVLLLHCAAVCADEFDDIVNGCSSSNAEFGVVAIQICIRDNQAARAAVMAYPEEAKEIVARCARRSDWGWPMVKQCIDNDIDAEAALAKYGSEHESLMEQCKTQYGLRGAARIKACVDQSIEAGRSPKN